MGLARPTAADPKHCMLCHIHRHTVPPAQRCASDETLGICMTCQGGSSSSSAPHVHLLQQSYGIMLRSHQRQGWGQ